MSDAKRHGKGARLYVSWHRSQVDNHDHAVTDEEFARGWRDVRGQYEGICGHVVLTTSMLVAPGRTCESCNAYLLALSTLSTFEQRLSPSRHRKASHLRLAYRRILNAVASALGPDRGSSADNCPRTPAGAGRAPTAPVLAGHHALRDER
ncbi:hypothetical protein ACFPN7_12120 [Amycolatopsis halotolerans]|uniref:hypothetical protein n=1 Tax=Amycolatopsis halotolerans TaxID=330083 RepID=UPI003607E485